MRLAQMATALGAELGAARGDARSAWPRVLDRAGPLIAPPARLVELIGAGPNGWTAQEGALKIREASYVAAEGLSAEQFFHGPSVALDEQDTLVVLDGGGPDGRPHGGDRRRGRGHRGEGRPVRRARARRGAVGVPAHRRWCSGSRSSCPRRAASARTASATRRTRAARRASSRSASDLGDANGHALDGVDGVAALVPGRGAVERLHGAGAVGRADAELVLARRARVPGVGPRAPAVPAMRSCRRASSHVRPPSALNSTRLTGSRPDHARPSTSVRPARTCRVRVRNSGRPGGAINARGRLRVTGVPGSSAERR